MQGVLDNLPVALMALWMDWPVAAVAIAVPVVLAMRSFARAGWCASPRRWGALLGFVAGSVIGAFGAFLVIGGGPGDLLYWLDWAFFVAVALGAGVYLAVLGYLGFAPARG